MTHFIVDDRGSWSGGGQSFLSNARLAAHQYPNAIAVGDPTDSSGIQVTPRNIPKRTSPFRHFILIPQNAWAWHGPTKTLSSYAHRSALRLGTKLYTRNATGLIRIGPMIPPHGLPSDSFLPNVLDESYESAHSQAELMQPTSSVDYFVAVGSLNDYRNYETVLAAHAAYMQRGGNKELHIIGGGSSSYLRTLGTPRNVVFHHSLSRAQTLTWMKQSSLTILPSLVEASPVTLLEAMAVQARIAVSDIPGHTYLINGQDNVYSFPPLDCSRLSQLMDATLDPSQSSLSQVAVRQIARDKWCADLLHQLQAIALANL